MFALLLRLRSVRVLAGVTSLALLGVAGVLVARDPIPPAATYSPTPPVGAAVPVAAATPPAPKPASDVVLARAVLAALDADPVLKDVNILVSVVDRGAVIGGPVRSEEVKSRAGAVVGRVPGIESVKNVCFVTTDPDPLLAAAALRLKAGAKPTGAALPGVALTPNSPVAYLPPLPPQPPADFVAIGPNPGAVVAKRPDSASAPGAGVLGAPVAPAGPGATAAVPGLPAVPEPKPAPMIPLPTAPGSLTGAPTEKPNELTTAVNTVRAADPRYARLTVDVKSTGELFVSGRAATPADVWDFAAAVRQIPGVTRVRVDPDLVK